MSKNENQIVVYQPNDTVRLDVRLENETVWLTQEQMALLFGRDQSVIARHVGNIFKEGELSRDSVYAKNAYTASDGKTYQVAFYNLDVVISVGYRVKSVQGTRFRQWATGVLKEYLLRGYSVNSRLNQLEDKIDRRLAKHDSDIAELKDKVDFFVQTQTPPMQGVFYDGQLWDARVLVLSLISRAKRSLILIDNWATAATLDLFAKKRKGVKVTVIRSAHFKKGVPHHAISDADVKTFNAQYPKLTVRYNETFHDRFLIIDSKELYLIGASLKDLGAKCFGFTKMDQGTIRGIRSRHLRQVQRRKGMWPCGRMRREQNRKRRRTMPSGGRVVLTRFREGGPARQGRPLGGARMSREQSTCPPKCVARRMALGIGTSPTVSAA